MILSAGQSTLSDGRAGLKRPRRVSRKGGSKTGVYLDKMAAYWEYRGNLFQPENLLKNEVF